MTRQGRTQLVLGILLVLAGIWFFADRSLPAFHDLVARYSEWPFNLVLIGAGLLVLGLILGPIAMVVLVSAVRAKFFDGLVADFGMLVRYMKERWTLGHESDPTSAKK